MKKVLSLFLFVSLLAVRFASGTESIILKSGIIWGQALFGALLMLLGLYCASVPVLNIEPDDLQVTLCLATIIGLSLAVCGGVRQVRVMRTSPPEGYGDHY